MTQWTLRASRLTKITRGSRVVFTEGLRIKFGTVRDVLHDFYRIDCDDGTVRRILQERVEALTTTAPQE